MLKKEYSKNKPVCKVTFTLPKEAVNGANEVKVLGEFNNWSWNNGLTMKSGKKEFTATMELTTGRRYEFRYLLDNGSWLNDWDADAYNPTPYDVENSVVIIDSVEVTAPKAKKAAAPAKKEKAAPAKKAAPKKAKSAAAPAKKAKAVAATPDDLTKIEGIGPKIAGLINAKGIYTFAELSKAKKTTLTTLLADAGARYKMHDPTTWAEQAKLAAKGEWEKLAKWQDELKGGKKK